VGQQKPRRDSSQQLQLKPQDRADDCAAEEVLKDGCSEWKIEKTDKPAYYRAHIICGP